MAEEKDKRMTIFIAAMFVSAAIIVAASAITNEIEKTRNMQARHNDEFMRFWRSR